MTENKIIICLDGFNNTKSESNEIKKLKRLKKEKWTFFISGEYSPSLVSSRDIRFFYTISTNEKNLYILGSGFPEKIYSIYKDIDIRRFHLNKEFFLGQMLKELENNGGPYIECVHDSSEMDLEKLFFDY